MIERSCSSVTGMGWQEAGSLVEPGVETQAQDSLLLQPGHPERPHCGPAERRRKPRREQHQDVLTGLVPSLAPGVLDGTLTAGDALEIVDDALSRALREQ